MALHAASIPAAAARYRGVISRPWRNAAHSPSRCTTGPSRSDLPIGATIGAVLLILVFTELIDWVGDVYSQVIYVAAIFGGILVAANRSRARDTREPSRLTRGSTPITPAGLPGPFMVTQALGILGLTMIVFAFVLQGNAGYLWGFSGFVLILVGGVGLVFWMAGIVSQRRRTA